MTIKTSIWFETKIKYDKMLDNGMLKTVREAYTVEATSFTTAEASIMKEMAPYISGDYQVVEEKIAQYKEVFFNDESAATKFYKAKVVLITLDEKSGREKKTAVYILVEAKSLEDARKVVCVEQDKSCLDYELVSVSETAIQDVFTA